MMCDPTLKILKDLRPGEIAMEEGGEEVSAAAPSSLVAVSGGRVKTRKREV
jgi:hypothetical protein